MTKHSGAIWIPVLFGLSLMGCGSKEIREYSELTNCIEIGVTLSKFKMKCAEADKLKNHAKKTRFPFDMITCGKDTHCRPTNLEAIVRSYGSDKYGATNLGAYRIMSIGYLVNTTHLLVILYQPDTEKIVGYQYWNKYQNYKELIREYRGNLRDTHHNSIRNEFAGHPPKEILGTPTINSIITK